MATFVMVPTRALVSASVDYVVFLMFLSLVAAVLYTVLEEFDAHLSRRRGGPAPVGDTGARLAGSDGGGGRAASLRATRARRDLTGGGGPALPPVHVLRAREPGVAGRELNITLPSTWTADHRRAEQERLVAALRARGLVVDELRIEQE